jgi:acyl-CoA carboxylase subunit beta
VTITTSPEVRHEVKDVAQAGFIMCPRCHALVYERRFLRTGKVCPECSWHGPLSAQERLAQLLDEGSVQALDVTAQSHDRLGFADVMPYAQRLADAQRRYGLSEAVICCRGTIGGRPVVVAVMDFRFLGGSLGSAVGDLITQTAEIALSERVSLLLVTASGGARMQEGVLSLMQMAKTSQAIGRLDEAGILTVSLVTDPTFGGVAASFATLCDVIIAEPGARLGFAGPRVIQQTIRKPLPEGFQSAESLLGHGMIDVICPRAGLRSTLAQILEMAAGTPLGPGAVTDPLVREAEALPEADPWETVQRARHPGRPTASDYISRLLHGFVELHGDRSQGDCPAVVAGTGTLDGLPVVVIGQQKGHDPGQLAAHNFGMASPAGYRKAARLFRLAAKLRIPVITLIDTPGADPGVAAEQQGQAVAIAENLRLMARLPVPVVAVITGEGGSGGALALGVANRVLMFGHSVYSVISPEGCAAILWKDKSAARLAAAALRLRAADLLREGVVDGVIPEPGAGVHESPVQAARLLHDALVAALRELIPLSAGQLIAERYDRFRRFGATVAVTSS